MDPILKTKLLTLFQTRPDGLTIHECATQLATDRHTLAKYLESLRSEGLLDYRAIGKAKLWTLTSSPLLHILSKDDPLGNSIKELFNNLDEHILVVNKDHTILWSNNKTTQHKGKCYEHYQGTSICNGCPAERTLANGTKETITLSINEKSHAISTVPIKDWHGNTVAFLEVIKT